MELHQLAYLVAVADEGSFTRAAEKLLVSQPGVSAQIRRLEREFGEDLLDRSGRLVRPTAVGAAVLPYARAALEAVDGAQLAVSELTGLLRGRCAIGTVTSPNVDLAGLLAGFHELHPMVEISLSAGDTDRLAIELKTGQLDAAILSIGAAAPDGLRVQVIVDQPIVAAVGYQHDLADRKNVALVDLARQAGRGVCGGRAVAACGPRGQFARGRRGPGGARAWRCLPAGPVRRVPKGPAGGAGDRPARATWPPGARLARVRSGQPGRPGPHQAPARAARHTLTLDRSFRRCRVIDSVHERGTRSGKCLPDIQQIVSRDRKLYLAAV